MGKGAFVKTDNGWMIDTKVKINEEWKHFTKRGYHTLQAAKADFETAKEIFIKKNQGYHTKMLFNDLYEEFYMYRSLKVNESTIKFSKYRTDYNILPDFNNLLLKDAINRDKIVNWYYKLIKNTNTSDNNKNKIIGDMKQILQYAYNKRYIDAETYQLCDVELQRINENDEHRAKAIWTPDEEKRFFEATKENEIDYLMFRLLFICATRISEFLALQVKCVDLDKNTIKISQQIRYTDKGFTLSKTLKTSNSYRTILIPKDISDKLRDYIKVFNLHDEDFLWHCASNKKKALTGTTIRNRLYSYCEKANVAKIVPHGVRHNMAVKMVKNCQTTQDIEICAARLGHTPSVFMDIYANHIKVEDQEKIMSKIFDN